MAKLPITMQSLRDKLLKAGLVSEDQAKKAEESAATKRARQEDRGPRADRPRSDRPREDRPREDRPRREGPPRGERAPQGPMIRARPAGPPPQRRESEFIPKLPPLPGSKEYQRIEARKQVEIDRKVRELVFTNQVPTDIGATVFYFMTRKGKLRRLTLTDPQAKKLENGELAVVERPDPGQIEHALVTPEIAEQIFAIFPKAVRFFNRKESPIGFMTDDELRGQQEREARAEFARAGRAARGEEEPTESAEEGSSAEAAPEGTAEAAAEPSAEAAPETKDESAAQ